MDNLQSFYLKSSLEPLNGHHQGIHPPPDWPKPPSMPFSSNSICPCFSHLFTLPLKSTDNL
jgi:hypothetical protein